MCAMQVQGCAGLHLCSLAGRHVLLLPAAAGCHALRREPACSSFQRAFSPPCLATHVRSYINGKPFVVREAERPFSNLEYTGIDRERVEGMEARLKQDVLAEV